jgi:hypothetical protein
MSRITILTTVGTGALALAVLVIPHLVVTTEPSGDSLGARAIAQATPAELDMIRAGKITVAQYNSITARQAACLRDAGATPTADAHADGRVDYGAMVRGKAMPPAAEQCWRIGEAVRATWVYDHLPFFSTTSALPGLAGRVRQLRAEGSG